MILALATSLLIFGLKKLAKYETGKKKISTSSLWLKLELFPPSIAEKIVQVKPNELSIFNCRMSFLLTLIKTTSKSEALQYTKTSFKCQGFCFF